ILWRWRPHHVRVESGRRCPRCRRTHRAKLIAACGRRQTEWPVERTNRTAASERSRFPDETSGVAAPDDVLTEDPDPKSEGSGPDEAPPESDPETTPLAGADPEAAPPSVEPDDAPPEPSGPSPA